MFYSNVCNPVVQIQLHKNLYTMYHFLSTSQLLCYFVLVYLIIIPTEYIYVCGCNMTKCRYV